MKRYNALFILIFSPVIALCQAPEDHYNKASKLSDDNKPELALAEIDKALLAAPNSTKYLNQKGNILYSLKKYEGAFSCFTKVITLDPKNLPAFINRGVLLYTTQNFDESIADCSMALQFAKADSDQIVLLVNRGAAKTGKRDFEGAYADYRQIYKMDSTNIAMLINLAAVCDEIGKGDETMKYLERVVKVDPKNIPAYGNMGFKYQTMGDHKKAIEYYNKVLELDPNEPLGYSNRSYSKLQVGDIQGALADIGKSLQYYPTNSYAYRVRALIYIEAKQRDKACADLAKSIELGFTTMYGDEVTQLQQKHCK